MFGFLGGRNRKRQIQDATKTGTKGQGHKQDSHGNRQLTHPTNARNQSYATPSLENDHFLDNCSVDMSLYTTPSKATLQYHRGVHNMHDWQSHDSSVTPEVASVQSKLGGWEAPPSPPTSARDKNKNDLSRRTRSLQNDNRGSSSIRSKSTSHSSEGKSRGQSSQRPKDRSSYEMKSVQSPLQPQGPVDVDSLSFVEEEGQRGEDQAIFSDLLSTFEAQSLADRMAPSTAPTHHERERAKQFGNTTKADDASKCSKTSKVSKQTSNERYKGSRGCGKQVSSNTASNESTNRLKFINSPSVGTKNSYRSETYSTAEGFQLDLDDSRSLGTEVSGLTMLTMEHSIAVQSRVSDTFGPISKEYVANDPSRNSESSSKLSLPGDASFSGLLSMCEEASRVNFMAPEKERMEIVGVEKDVISKAKRLQNCESATIHETSLDMDSDQSQHPTPSPLPGHGEYFINTAKANRTATKTVYNDKTETTHKSVGSLTESRSIRSERSKETMDISNSMSRGKGETKKKKKKKKKKLDKEVAAVVRTESIGAVSSTSEIEILPRESSIDDLSFSGLLSTMEAESFAGRLDADLPLENLEIPDWQSEGLSTARSLDDCASQNLSTCNSGVSRSQASLASISGIGDKTGISPTTPLSRVALLDGADMNPTIKRSNLNTWASIDGNPTEHASDTYSRSDHDVGSFSNIRSVFEARSAACSKLEPPATKRLLPQEGFPLRMEEASKDKALSSVSSSRQSPKLITEEEYERSPLYQSAANKNHGDVHDRHQNSSEPKLQTEDDCSVFSSSCMTIDDQSTILPPPLEEQPSCTVESQHSSKDARGGICLSKDSTEIDVISTTSFFDDRTETQSEGDSEGNLDLIFGEKRDQMEDESTSTPILEHSLQYSESIETSLQYSQSTAPVNVVSDVSSLLISAEKHRSQQKSRCNEGPIDLDETIADSNSEASSLYGPSALLHTSQSTALKAFEEESCQVKSPLLCDDEEAHQFVDDDDDLDEVQDRSESLSNIHYKECFDEAVVEHSYKETMESLSSARFEAGSLLLTESELEKHAKSSQFQDAPPSSTLPGYDSWKRKQFERQRYFAQVHQKAMKKRDRLLEHRISPANSQQIELNTRRVRQCDSVDSITQKSSLSPILSSCASEPFARVHGISQWQQKKGWIFSRKKLAKKKEKNDVLPSKSYPPGHSNIVKKKCEGAVVTLDNFMKVSQDEPDDVSLVPMNKLDPGVVSLSSSIPQVDTLAATKSHNLDAAGVGPRLLALQHLEMERAKNRKAEKEKTKLEIREQKRIALLKERELERQRRLNAPRDKIAEKSIVTDKLKCSTQGLNPDQLLERNLSFGTTNTAQSSIKSPSCVLSPCILCNAAERSHIAQPCMHFYFCQDCANELSSSVVPVCPICTTPNVYFSRVYT